MSDTEEIITYEAGEKELVDDETDWGFVFDDMDQDNWEDHMGGPDDDYFD